MEIAHGIEGNGQRGAEKNFNFRVAPTVAIMIAPRRFLAGQKPRTNLARSVTP